MSSLCQRFFCRVILVLSVIVIAPIPEIFASSFAENLSGKTVKLIIAGSPGGSHDAYGRTLVKHLETLLPETDFVVQNNRKAGGILAAKEVQEANGTSITLGLFHPSLVYMQLLDQQDGAFDLTRFKWVASLSRDQRFYGVRKDFAEPTLKGALAHDGQLLAGTSAAGATSDVDLLLASALTGLHTKVVYGFRSSAQRKAIIAGELDMMVGSVAGSQNLLESGDLVPILKISPDSYPDSFADVPALQDSIQPGAPAQIVELMETINDTGRVLAAGPQTSDEDVEALRLAVAEIFQGAEYQQENEALGLFLSPATGDQVEARIGILLSGRPELKAMLAKAVECGRQISEAQIETCDFASW